MKRLALIAASIFGLAVAAPAAAQEANPPTPASVVAAAAPEEWVHIAPENLLVMELAPDAAGHSRQVVIQLMPPPFSQPWVENIRTLARAHWWDGTSVNRVQDNYVTQWGDATEAKRVPVEDPTDHYESSLVRPIDPHGASIFERISDVAFANDAYAARAGFLDGWPFAGDTGAQAWPIHCYGYVGVGRNLAPDTGTGAELYTIIGQPQRHMDRNLAVVGRVIEGMEHLSGLPRGHGELGFYTEEEAHLRVPILSVRLASELPDPPAYEFLSTDSESFARLVAVRANRQDAFYTVPAGGVDICSVPVPVRAVSE